MPVRTSPEKPSRNGVRPVTQVHLQTCLRTGMARTLFPMTTGSKSMSSRSLDHKNTDQVRDAADGVCGAQTCWGGGGSRAVSPVPCLLVVEGVCRGVCGGEWHVFGTAHDGAWGSVSLPLQ